MYFCIYYHLYITMKKIWFAFIKLQMNLHHNRFWLQQQQKIWDEFSPPQNDKLLTKHNYMFTCI